LSGKPGTLALTLGDPAGIGPEIAVKAVMNWKIRDVQLALYGPESLWEKAFTRLGVENPPVAVVPLPMPAASPSARAAPSRWGGMVAMGAIEAAVHDAISGTLMGVVTGPVSKESLHLAGWRYPGQTEILGALTNAEQWAMMLANGKHRVVLATRHIPLRNVASSITSEGLRALFLLVDRSLTRFLGRKPRIVVCGLNPHAGEGGLLGTEEETVIAPAIESASGCGVMVRGPVSGEEAFMTWGETADIVIAMYHDQGAIPVKSLGLHRTVNVTLGLPIVRTSPGHGTAFSLAETGRADERSFLTAMYWAVALASAGGSPRSELAAGRLHGSRANNTDSSPRKRAPVPEAIRPPEEPLKNG
jgi:4-hydroxythreonine-4-phosphate dehydrogenase